MVTATGPEVAAPARLDRSRSERAPGAYVLPVLGLVTFAVSLGLYVPSLMPGVGFWDTAEFQTVGPVLGIAHPTGFPTYTLLGWFSNVLLSPVGESAFRMNLLSALLVAGAAAFLALATQRVIGRPALALGAGTEMELEAYEDVAKQELERIAGDATAKFRLQHVDIVHRIGRLLVGENILIIVVAAGHRSEAYDDLVYY